MRVPTKLSPPGPKSARILDLVDRETVQFCALNRIRVLEVESRFYATLMDGTRKLRSKNSANSRT